MKNASSQIAIEKNVFVKVFKQWIVNQIALCTKLRTVTFSEHGGIFEKLFFKNLFKEKDAF